MSSEAFTPQWTWADDVDNRSNINRNYEEVPAASTTHSVPSEPTEAPEGRAPDPTPTQPRRHYKPRTCRICLEVVQPSTELDDSFAGRIFTSKAQGRYVSEDPDLGRLMSPCQCKGSQKYVHEGCLQAWRN